MNERPVLPPVVDQTRTRHQLAAVMLVVAVAFFNAVDSVLVRILTTELHPFVIGFFRALFGLVVVLPWIAARPKMLASRFRWLHVVRAVLKLAALVSFFFALAAAPLADVTAIAFTAPILVALGAWIFLGERANGWRLVAIAMAFAGVLIILRPGGDGMNPAIGFALLGAVLTAAMHLLLKRMSGSDSTNSLVAWNLIVTVPLAALPAMLFWSQPSREMLALLALQGIMGAIAMTAVTKAMSLADVSVIAPVDFLRLPFVAIMAFVLFEEAAGLPTWIGGIIIFAATLLTAKTGRYWRSSTPLP